MDTELVTLATICGGAVEEVFQRELALILANIADINTDASAKRKITLSFEIEPFPDRSGAQVSFTCTGKTVGANGVGGQLFLFKSGGQLLAHAHNPRQARLFQQPAPPTEDPEKKKLQ